MPETIDQTTQSEGVEPNGYQLTAEERAEVHSLLRELFGIDTDRDPDPLIDKPMIARLAGVSVGTPGQWEQRTREGKEKIDFPEPDEQRYRDKPQWHAVSTIVQRFLKPTGRWPRGAVARLSTRATERYTFTQLIELDPKLAAEIRELNVADGKPRSIQGWRGWRTRTRNERDAA